MIVTKSWLNEWIDLDGISTEEITNTFNSIGLEVERVTQYRVPNKIVFGKVIECIKHPNADKLNICQVDIGTSIRQIVCGAANVQAGLDVIVATIGAVMPSGMQIKPVKLRGVESEGMICSSSEVGLEDTGKGILALDSSIGDFHLGQEVSENAILNDDLIELELTANRGDCLSVRGVARDLSAAFNRPIKEYNYVDNDEKRGIGRILSLNIEKDLDVSLCYKALDLQSLNLPLIVKLRLTQLNESRETDIESILLYMTHASGVILRGYSHKYFCENEDDVMAKVTLFENEEGYAGVKGKTDASTVGIIQNDASKVGDDNGIILLEASYIAPDVVSKKMADHKTEAGPMFYKTSRGSEPELAGGLAYCIEFIAENSHSTTFGGHIELSHSVKEKIVIIKQQEIDDIIGASIDKSVISNILKNLGFDISKSSSENFIIHVPQFRHDIEHKQDIIEEIVRMVGIANIPSKPFVFTEDNRLEDDYFAYKKRTIFRHRGAQSGFFETVHFVFDEKKVLNSYGFETTKKELELLNPIVQTLDTLRPTLLTGLLKAASNNVKNGYSCVKLFEIGSVFTPSRDESTSMAFLFSGDVESENLANTGKPKAVDFAFFIQKISDVIGNVELKEYKTTHTLSHNYQTAQVVMNGEVVGELFRVHPDVEKAYDLPSTFMCELEFSKISHGLKIAKKTSKYQVSFRDLSVIMPKSMSYESVKSVIEKNLTDEVIRFYPVDKYSDESLGEDMSLSLRFVLQSEEKTLEEEDITSSIDAILNALQSELGIGLR